MKFKRLLAGILAFSLSFSYAAFAKEDAIIADSTVHTVSPGLVYSSSVELHKGYRQEIYSFEYTPQSDTAILPIYGKYIYGTSSVGQGIADYDGESRVVGGINTDFFITTTGIPLSCLIDGREVVSSCDGRAAIGFDESGNAIIGYPQITSRLYFGEEEFSIAHINKTPAVWGFYLVTDKFYSTTKSSVESIEIVMRPFVKETEENSQETEKITSDTKTPVTDAENTAPEADNEKTVTDTEAETEAENEVKTEVESEDEKVIEDTPDEMREDEELSFDFSPYSFTDENIEINSELSLVITEIRDNSMNSEIPEDCFVLCVPKEQFGSTVSHLKVGDELVLKTEISQSFENCINIFGAGNIILEDGEFAEIPNDSIFTSRQPRTAVGVRGDGTVVFVCVDGRRAGESYGFTIKELSEYLKSKGCVTALNFDGGGSTTFYAADIGEGYANLKNIPSDGYERRVSDGLIFLNTAKSGETPEYAAKYPSNHLIFNEKVELELSGDILFADDKLFPVKPEYDYYNLTVDEEFGKTKDNVFVPNGKTGTASIILQTRKGDSSAEFEVGYVNIIDTVSDFVIKSDDTLITPFEDSAVLKISVSHNTLPIQYSEESIVWEIYIKDEEVKEETSENVDAESDIIENVDVESTDSSESLEEAIADDTEDITDTESSSDVNDTDESEESDEIEAEEVIIVDSIENYTEGYIKASIYDAIFDNINFEFYPITEGKEYRLIARLGKSIASIDIISEKYPFLDTEMHWARKTAYEMYRDGYFSGELDNDGNRYFMPGRNMTRSEFCTVVGRILGIEIEEDNNDIEVTGNVEEEVTVSEEKQDFYDVPEWASGYVRELYKMGYIDNLVAKDENGILLLDSQKAITRMDVVTVFAELLDFFELENSDEVISEFSDVADLTDEQKGSAGKLVVSGIIKGYDDNTLRLTSDITRAEVATIFHRYIGLRNFILENQSKIFKTE